ncbi:hypothetical protein Bpfe_020768 [Biomphalaria pfeifferi]|uniref:Uncharacterized protein n=1 Tax=Biomphalaria pfeifferi TaxID=112525 RepID=A0AAD8B8G7_BIOPF|nr:hypothetical protein Bpfe_020768 [Biomphalaria pfeifferi]
MFTVKSFFLFSFRDLIYNTGSKAYNSSLFLESGGCAFLYLAIPKGFGGRVQEFWWLSLRVLVVESKSLEVQMLVYGMGTRSRDHRDEPST